MDEKKRRGRHPKNPRTSAMPTPANEEHLGCWHDMPPGCTTSGNNTIRPIEGLEQAQKVGRPSKYNPEYCETLPAMFADGQSVLEVSVQLGVSRDTIYEWAKVYPEFSDALTRGKAISQAWWEKIGRENLFDESEYDAENKVSTTKKFNEKLWSKNVSCRFRDDWTDKQEIALDASMEIKHTFDPEGI